MYERLTVQTTNIETHINLGAHSHKENPPSKATNTKITKLIVFS